MKWRSLPAATVAIATGVVFFLSAIGAPAAMASVVEHTFVVRQVKMTHLCKETLATVVNGQFPGPAIEVTEGDSVTVHVVNQSPYNLTIHWHGVKQRLNCWADGVPMITQCPILPNQNFTYRFNVAGQEGTLWWHAHVSFLRASVHGALIIRPRRGASSYPFPKPYKEIPIIIGAVEDGYLLDVEPGRTYLLRIINAALFAEYYLKIAGHKFTVVAADANYVSPYTTDVIAIAPGETVDALLVADADPGRYYMVAVPNQSPLPDPQSPTLITRGIVQYSNKQRAADGGGRPSSDIPVSPEMPDQHDMITSFYFHGNLTGLHHPQHLEVPKHVDERLFITLGLGSICRGGQSSCKRSENNESMDVATMNSFTYQQPAVATPLLELHYYSIDNRVLSMLQELPDKPPRVFNYTDPTLIPPGPKEAKLEPTSKATIARRFRQGAVVEVVFQGMAILSSESNPMHLHGHDVFVLAQGEGNYDATRDVPMYNLVNPAVKNTVFVPRLGWVAVRFIADNPGIWYMHCHFGFHLSMGMVALFIVEDGSTVNTSLPAPPADFPTCGHDHNVMSNEFYPI
ncbi:hypothetical protein SEVIR_8G223000v4 [Setaria viridis]|uniref:Laccase n=1 Tax=Setaria viridis TaxID=4556 RepID=A0A4U6TLJ4_SETVI|nr:laccase-15-like isoform X4 [Setaria viridis]TKW02104.1 hypothetical protein SEVIR_8G223000v2 [Setaria viridis]